MGVVFRARDPRIGRSVAIKLLSVPDETLRDRFEQEARSVGNLTHRNIVTIFDFGEHEGQSYIVMEFVEGVTLADQIHENVPMALWRKLEIMEELTAGLDYAHNKGIVHRDIKPANVMTDRDGVVKILDFGIARVGNITMTQAGMMLGTPNYMSPEQFESGKVDRRSDIFSVGVLFYELLTYHKAFSGEQMWDVMKAVISQPPRPIADFIPGIDRAVAATVDRAVEKDPARRYQTLSEMRSDLADARSRLSVKLPSPLSETMLTPAPESAPQTPRLGVVTPRPSSDRMLLQKRRADQIEAHLTEARRAFDAGELEKSLESCDQALMIDPDEPRIQELFDGVRSAIAARDAERDRQRAIADALTRARARLTNRDFESAIRAAGQVLAQDPGNDEAHQLTRLAAAEIE